ncbi:hypothetical protein [Cupriavidus pauculus]|uniref:hypothetical protein n=1 Tax=Cupriavidus pauculus TaxID=82633 RepID=UPI00203E4F16|nr:hypothetical protein [Cupriavidus pauculus]MCM3606043.1 hypothetical protein [Cupriavidus pauculus]
MAHALVKWWDQVRQRLAGPSRVPRAGASHRTVASAPRSGVPFWSQSTLWVDGHHAALLGPSGKVLHRLELPNVADVPAALTAMEAVVARPRMRGMHGLRVVLGAPFARYLVLPWQALPRPGDWITLARRQFMQAGLSGVEAWRFVVPDGSWGQSRLAAAVPEALCGGVARLCKSRGMQLTAIEPAFMLGLSTQASRVRDGAIAVVELEPVAADVAVAHIGFRQEGRWTGFTALPVLGPFADVMRDASVLCATSHPERVYVIASQAGWNMVSGTHGTEWLQAPWDIAA